MGIPVRESAREDRLLAVLGIPSALPPAKKERLTAFGHAEVHRFAVRDRAWNIVWPFRNVER